MAVWFGCSAAVCATSFDSRRVTDSTQTAPRRSRPSEESYFLPTKKALP
jgi:hypothetical protein